MLVTVAVSANGRTQPNSGAWLEHGSEGFVMSSRVSWLSVRARLPEWWEPPIDAPTHYE